LVRILATVLAALTVVPGSAMAQIGFEMQPFAGYKFGGKLRPGGDDLTLPWASIHPSRVLGASAMVTYREGRATAGGEFSWSMQPTSATVTGGESPGGNLRIEQYLIHGLIGMSEEGRRRPLPFGLFGVGVARMSGFTTFNTRYTLSFGGGIRYFFSKHFGVRVQARFAPVHLWQSSEAYTAVYQPGVSTGTTQHVEKYFNQGEITAGWIVRWR
jgi:hypothetical protein